MQPDKTINPSLKLLLDIAEEMILERGCRATTLQDIADKSGLTKGAIYHYVKSKDELFGLILEAGMEQTNRRFFEAVTQAAVGPEGLQGPLGALSERIRRLARADSAANLIFIYLLSQKDKPDVARILGRYYEAGIQTATRWIEVGQQHGAIPAHIDARQAARMFSLFKNGLQVQNLIASDEESIGEMEIFQFMLNALGGGGTADSGSGSGS
jgi:AcrR family transcriptional regulator